MSAPRADLEPADLRLLDRVQASVPLVGRPFATLAGDLGTKEQDVLGRLRRLAESGVLRQIGAIFDTRACGYASALVAARVAPGALARAAAVVAAHPGVSHCYERDHAWNLWYTLAVPPTSRLGLDGTVARLGAAAATESMRALPALRVFKIAARFALAAGEEAPIPPAAGRPAPAPLTDEEIDAVRVLQEPLALVAEPFVEPARAAGMSQAELLARATTLLDRGVMRRFAALLDHRRAGFTANVMAAWALPAARIDAAGRRIAAFPAVTHCYERPVVAGWPYALFSMIHGASREACLAVVDAIRAAIRPDGAALLWTLGEFKKVRLRLFTPAYEAWEVAAAGSAG